MHATANLGDTLTYTVKVQNTGQDGATGTTFSDLIPAGTVFVPGSITLNGAPLTDAGGDDLGEFAGGRVVVRLGTGASATTGGTLAPSASATVSFQVTVATTGLASGDDDREHGGARLPGRDDRGSEHGGDSTGRHARARSRSGDRQDARAGRSRPGSPARTRSRSATSVRGRRPGR